MNTQQTNTCTQSYYGTIVVHGSNPFQYNWAVQ